MSWYKLHKKAHSMIGYRVMTVDDAGNLKDGLPLDKGAIHNKPEGLYLSLDSSYVIDYYSHGSDDVDDPQEVLGKYQFDSDELMQGNLSDKYTEFTVPRAKLIDFTYLHPRKEIEGSDPSSGLQYGREQDGA